MAAGCGLRADHTRRQACRRRPPQPLRRAPVQLSLLLTDSGVRAYNVAAGDVVPPAPIAAEFVFRSEEEEPAGGRLTTNIAAVRFADDTIAVAAGNSGKKLRIWLP